jgi:hypothetical protein
MALTAVATLLLFLARGDDPPRSSSVHVETDVTIGRSTEDVSAAATQIRLFGANSKDWRFFLEAAWADRRGEPSDAFGAAYPYDGRLRPMETFVEKMFRPASALVGVKGGRYRTPFGIYSRSDHAYNGFLRAPLVRYGGNFALSNDFLESGADVLIGRPSLSVETSIGTARDAGDAPRRAGLDTVVRAQGYYRSLIVGASFLDTPPNMSGEFVQGRMIFRGIDARWMTDGVLVRGEWMNGRPFDGVTTRGGYIDAIVHRVGMGPVTAVARAERLDYDAGPFSQFLRRYTAGARVRISSMLSAVVNAIGQPSGLANGRHVALDLGLTCSLRF